MTRTDADAYQDSITRQRSSKSDLATRRRIVPSLLSALSSGAGKLHTITMYPHAHVDDDAITVTVRAGDNGLIDLARVLANYGCCRGDKPAMIEE